MLHFKKPVATSAALVAALCLIAAPASAAETNTRPLEVERTGTLTDLSATISPSISAPADSPVAFERPAVASVAAVKAAVAPVVPRSAVEAPVAAPAAPAQSSPAAVPAPAPASVPVAPAAASPAPVVRAAQPAAAPVRVAAAPAPRATAASGKGAVIAAAALAQLGVAQDCTALVEKSLQAAGINAPVGAFSPLALTRFGTPTSNPSPGDIVYYANGGMGMPHVAIYIGNGMAVHGGWNGGTTAIFSVNVGTGHSFFHVG